MARDSGALIILVPIWYLYLVGWLAGEFHAYRSVWGIGLGGPIVFVGASLFLGKRKREAEERQRLTASCQHGTHGAILERSKCSRCQAELAAKERETLKQKEAERLEREHRREQAWAKWTAKVRTPQYLRQMDPYEFENLICTLFECHGYDVKPTPRSADGGVDAFLRIDGKLHLLQCKRVKGSVGEPVLRDLFGTMVANEASSGIVVTTGKVSRKGREWASVPARRIRIIELSELADLIRKHFSEGSLVPTSFQVDGDDFATDVRICPKCGHPLRERKGKWGSFLGCAGYPECRFTRNLSGRQTRRKFSVKRTVSPKKPSVPAIN